MDIFETCECITCEHLYVNKTDGSLNCINLIILEEHVEGCFTADLLFPRIAIDHAKRQHFKLCSNRSYLKVKVRRRAVPLGFNDIGHLKNIRSNRARAEETLIKEDLSDVAKLFNIKHKIANKLKIMNYNNRNFSFYTRMVHKLNATSNSKWKLMLKDGTPVGVQRVM